jgi:hypothetical protein
MFILCMGAFIELAGKNGGGRITKKERQIEKKG